MYSKILVPLDGSKLAESVLDHVESIASGCGTTQVIFVSVTEPIKVTNINPGTETGEHVGYHILSETVIQAGQVPSTSPGTLVGELPLEKTQWTRTLGKLYNEADRYLDKIQRRFEKKGIASVTQVLLGKPADAIISYADDQKVDLIVMASHGRSGISRWASGSIADKVFRGTCVPVLMVRAPGCAPGV
jgi:nucleotide-binding universal stress UspA family protein